MMELYIITGLIVLASLSGLIFLVKNAADWLHDNSKFIIAFSAGIFAVVTYNLTIESFAFSETWYFAVLAIIVGFFFFYFLEGLFPDAHHHDEEYHSHTHAWKSLVLGDVLHNIGDGILLALAFSIDTNVGIIAGLGILLHEFIKDLGKFSILKSSGFSTFKALVTNFLTALGIAVGVLIGSFASNIESIIGVVLGFASGAFLHLVFTDLIPQSIAHSKKDKKYVAYLLLILAGVLTILALNKISLE